MERCPLCRARLGPESICPRCGADLTLAQLAETESVQRLQHAIVAFAAGDRPTANAHAQAALRLHRTPLNEVLARWLKD